MCPESPAQDSADVAARNQQTTERENNATQHAACRVANNEHKITAQRGGTESASAGARGKGGGHGKGKGGGRWKGPEDAEERTLAQHSALPYGLSTWSASA